MLACRYPRERDASWDEGEAQQDCPRIRKRTKCVPTRSTTAPTRSKGNSKVRRHQKAVTVFWETVLGWWPSDLHAEMPEEPIVPCLPRPPLRIRDSAQYFSCWYTLALAEAHATLREARTRLGPSRLRWLIDCSRSVTARLVDTELCDSSRQIARISLTIVNRGIGLCGRDYQPGSIFAVPLGARARVLLAVVAPHFATLSADSEWTLWIGSADRALLSAGLAKAGLLTAVHIESLVSAERMAVTSLLEPAPAFIHRLLGSSGAEHLKFESSDDEPHTSVPPVADVPTPESYMVATAPSACNVSQSMACARCMVAAERPGSIELVHGPPGCGKTHFLAMLLQSLIRARPSVRLLVCAPSNKAVSVALCAYLRAGGSSAHCALVGTDEMLALLPYNAASCFVFRPTAAAEMELVALAATVRASQDAFCSTAEVACLVRVAHVEACIQSWAALLRTLRRLAVLASSLLDVDDPRFSPGCTDPLQALQQEVAQTLSRIDSPEFSAWPCCRRRVMLQTVSSLADAAAFSVRNELPSSDAYGMVESANIVFATLCSAGQALVRNMTKPDMLIVDEAAQALEGEFLIAVLCQPRSLVLIGDPLQLPATARSKAPALAKISAMERLMAVPSQSYVLLDTQYRMHSEICSFPARHFYKGALLSAKGVDLREPPFSAGEWPPYAFVDVAHAHEHVLKTKSIQNAVEASAIISLALHLRDKLQVNLASHLVVITFYAAQQQRIRASAAASAMPELVVHTVDSFQGSEAAIVLCSCVRSNRQGRVGFLADPRRLNVALTRAMHSLIIVGSLSTLEASDSPDLRAMVEDAVARGRAGTLSSLFPGIAAP